MDKLKISSEEITKVENFAPFFFWSKWILIILTIIYIIMYIISLIMKIRLQFIKKNTLNATNQYQNFIKKFDIFNNVLFYLIAIFVLIICIVIAMVTKKESIYIIDEFKNSTMKVFTGKSNQGAKQGVVDVPIPKYFTSLIFWMFIYFIIIIIAAIAGKIMNQTLVYDVL